MADGTEAFEFQRLHGMGEALHEVVKAAEGTRCRIYAPVGAHRDLLAYLVRRLLENGANSSFVNQMVDEDIPPEQIARDPFADIAERNAGIPQGPELFGSRRNSRGCDLTDPVEVARLSSARALFDEHTWRAGEALNGPRHRIGNPARPGEVVGDAVWASIEDVEAAMADAVAAQPGWAAAGASARSEILRNAADLYEVHADELMALATREAGKTWLDGVGEVREAVDFLRYYADQVEDVTQPPRGVFVCIRRGTFPSRSSRADCGGVGHG